MEIFKTMFNYSVIAVVVTVLLIQSVSCEIPDEIRDYIELRLKDLNEKHEAEIMKLKLSFKEEIKQQDGSCQKTMDVLHNRIQSLEHLVKNAFDEPVNENQVHITEHETRNMNSKKGKRQSGIDSAVKGISKRHDDMGTKVAFFATLSATVPHLGINQDIVFDHIMTNIGNAYIAHHGVFVAPVDGTYVFSVTLRATHVFTNFVVNGTIIAKLDLFPAENGNIQASHTMIVSMKKGHDASVQSSAVETSIKGDRYSSFSGFLLFEDFAPEIIG